VSHCIRDWFLLFAAPSPLCSIVGAVFVGLADDNGKDHVWGDIICLVSAVMYVTAWLLWLVLCNEITHLNP
jgi:hypothetical protein